MSKKKKNRQSAPADGSAGVGGDPAPAMENPTSPWIDRGVFLAVALVGAVLDIVSKYVVFGSLGVTIFHRNGLPGCVADREISLIGETLRLQAAMNPGAVFGLFHGKWLFLVIFTLVALGIIGWVMFKSRDSGPVLTAGLGLVCAGAIGNLWDRFLFNGVRDFILFQTSLLEPFMNGGRWPNFNFADAWIVMGIPLILLADFLNARKEKARQEKQGDLSLTEK